MSSINFDNPYLLLIAVILLPVIIGAYLITVNSDNRNIHNKLSFTFHILIAVFVTLVMAKTSLEVVMTETNVYVLADVSYSSNENLKKIDEYIDDLSDNLPRNSKMGLVCFGKDYELMNTPDEEMRSVLDSNVDDSATDIASALEYTQTLFKDDVIKRIVIISDGKETNSSNIVSIIASLAADDIYVDAIYLDNNIKEGVNEVLISDINYNPSTYVNNDVKATLLVQSNTDCKAILNVTKNGSDFYNKALTLTKGLNVVNFSLDTSVSGEFNYVAKVNLDDDKCSYNNVYYFNQSVTDTVKVLYISDIRLDQVEFKEMFDQDYEVDYYMTNYNKSVPYSVEDLCKYDEIILSNVDVSKLTNAKAFVQNLDTVVSKFGKTLITLGNTHIQDSKDGENEVLENLSTILPTKYGNDEQDNKLFVIVMDISRSMDLNSKALIAKKSAKAAIDLLNEDDLVVVIGFYGEVEFIQKVTDVSDKESIKKKIDDIDCLQGTFLGAGLRSAYTQLLEYTTFDNKEVLLLSDGLPYGDQGTEALAAARDLTRIGATVSAINTNSKDGAALLEQITTVGRGYYYYFESLDDVDVSFKEVADDITDTVVEGGNYEVTINKTKNEMVEEFSEIEEVKGFYYNKAKSSATTVLSSNYVSASGKNHDVPLCSYWGYGSGNVLSFASSLCDFWLDGWTKDSNGYKFICNVLKYNVPEQRIETPFIFDVTENGLSSTVYVTVPNVNRDSKLDITITSPSGIVVNDVMAFDTERYYFEFETSEVGNYNIDLTYSFGNTSYDESYIYSKAYLDEYNSFEDFKASSLYYMVSTNGVVSEDGHLELANTNSLIRTYIFDFTPLFMILSVLLFVADIIVRKLRLEDIKSIIRKFKRKVDNR